MKGWRNKKIVKKNIYYSTISIKFNWIYYFMGNKKNYIGKKIYKSLVYSELTFFDKAHYISKIHFDPEEKGEKKKKTFSVVCTEWVFDYRVAFISCPASVGAPIEGLWVQNDRWHYCRKPLPLRYFSAPCPIN